MRKIKHTMALFISGLFIVSCSENILIDTRIYSVEMKTHHQARQTTNGNLVTLDNEDYFFVLEQDNKLELVYTHSNAFHDVKVGDKILLGGPDYWFYDTNNLQWTN